MQRYCRCGAEFIWWFDDDSVCSNRSVFALAQAAQASPASTVLWAANFRDTLLLHGQRGCRYVGLFGRQPMRGLPRPLASRRQRNSICGVAGLATGGGCSYRGRPPSGVRSANVPGQSRLFVVAGTSSLASGPATGLEFRQRDRLELPSAPAESEFANSVECERLLFNSPVPLR
jgi:hypothetical protein